MIKNLLRVLLKLISDEIYAPFEVRLSVHLRCVDPDGRVQESGAQAPVHVTSPRLRALQLGTIALFVAVFASSLILCPSGALVVPVIGRVTTAGLNALLNSTLANSVTSTTWYVGLMKYVSNTGVTNGTTTFTDANGTFVAGDVGRNILIKGAGSGGADLATTISAVGSNTSITLASGATNTANNVQYAFECRAADTMGSHTSFAESTAYSGTRPTWTPGTVSGGSVSNSGSPASFSMTGPDYIFGAFLVSNSTQGGSTGTLYGAGVSSGGVVIGASNGSTVSATITATATAT